MKKSLISTFREHKNYKNVYKSLLIKIQKLKMNFRSRLENVKCLIIILRKRPIDKVGLNYYNYI